MPSGNRPRTKELYNRVLVAIRAHGYAPSKVALLCGLHRNTVTRLWEKGWPDREGCTPIRGQLEMDQIIARAARANADPDELVPIAQQVMQNSLDGARQTATDAASMLSAAAKQVQEMQAKAEAALASAHAKLEEVEALAKSRMDDAEKSAQVTLHKAEIEAKQRMAKLLADAKVDAAETLADEANAAKFGRKAALSATAIAALVLRDAQGIATQLRTALGDLSKLGPKEAIRVTHQMVRLVESAEKALILALQAERLRVGEPTEVLGIASMEGSLDEKQIKLRAVERALEKKRVKLSLVTGGVNAVGPAGADGAQRAGAAQPGVASGATPGR